MRRTDTLVSRVDETRPDIGVPHHVRRNRVERPRLFRSHSPSVVEKRIVSTDLTLLSLFTREAWSMRFSPPRMCTCVFVSSIVLFVTYRFTYDRISCVGGRTSAYRVPRKTAPPFFDAISFSPLVS